MKTLAAGSATTLSARFMDAMKKVKPDNGDDDDADDDEASPTVKRPAAKTAKSKSAPVKTAPLHTPKNTRSLFLTLKWSWRPQGTSTCSGQVCLLALVVSPLVHLSLRPMVER